MSKGGGTAIGKGHELIGTADCLVCAEEIPAKLTSGGKLSLCCPWCDAPIYLNKGTKAFDLALAKVKRAAPAPAASDPAIAPAPVKAPEPQIGRTPEPERKEPPRRSFAGPLFGGT
jgi:hypothetical protein